MNFNQFMHDYPWAIGIIMILGGPIVALYGRRFFPWVIAGIVSLTFLIGTLLFCSIIGLFNTYGGLAGSIGAALVIGLLSGWFIMKTVWISVGILGLIGGFFMGTMIYTIVLAAFHTGALWAMITFSILCSIIGGFLSFKFSK